MEFEQHVNGLEEEGRRLADAAADTSLQTPIPTCPGWDVETLLRHLGGIHRWAAMFVSEGRMTPMHTNDEPIRSMRAEPAQSELVDWFRAGHEALLDVLRAAPADVECWTFLPTPTPLAFWARRQAHETAVHRADLQLALGALDPYPPVFAADGVDEMLYGWLDGSKGRLQFHRSATLAIHAADVDRHWLIRISPDGASASQDEASADCRLHGLAGDLYLLLWNRLPLDRTTITISGDGEVPELWRQTVRI